MGLSKYFNCVSILKCLSIWYNFPFKYVLHNVLVNVSRSLEYTLSLVLKIETGCCVSVESYKMLMKFLRLLHMSIRKGDFLRTRMGVYARDIFIGAKAY